MSIVVVVDYGMGNIKSVQRGLEQVGASVILSSNPDVIVQADRVVLPGVGAFEDGMKELVQGDLDQALKHFTEKGNPLMGICLGMQMLLTSSEEFGNHQGLGLIPGKVQAIPHNENGMLKRKIPHIGWSALKKSAGSDGWQNSCLQDIEDGEFFYFVHSFMAAPEQKAHQLAFCVDEGLEVTAAIKKDNVTGLQFHPEKSGLDGLKILNRFVTE